IMKINQKTSPNRESRNKKEKEDQRESDGTSSDESTSDVDEESSSSSSDDSSSSSDERDKESSDRNNMLVIGGHNAIMGIAPEKASADNLQATISTSSLSFARSPVDDLVEKKNKVNKENVAQIIPTSTTERNNGRSPITPTKPSDSMDDSEVQSWRRPSSLRNKTSPPDDRNQKEEGIRTISTPARLSSSREEESIQRTSSSPEKDESPLSVSGGSTLQSAAANRERLKARSCPTLTHLDQEQGGTLTQVGGGGRVGGNRGPTLTQTQTQSLPSTTAPLSTKIGNSSSGFSVPLSSLSLTQSQRLSSSAQNIPSAHNLSTTSSLSVRSHQSTPTCMDWTLSTASQQQKLLNKLSIQSTSHSQMQQQQQQQQQQQLQQQQQQPISETKSLPSSLNKSQVSISSPMPRPATSIIQSTISSVTSMNQTPSCYVDSIISSQSILSEDKGFVVPILSTTTATTLSDITISSSQNNKNSSSLNSNRILTSLSPVLEQKRIDGVHTSLNTSHAALNSSISLPLTQVSCTSVTYSTITTTAMPTTTTITVASSSSSSLLSSSASSTYTTTTPGLDSFSTNTSTNMKDPRILARSQSLRERIHRNHVDSMARVSLPADSSSPGVLNTSISPPVRSTGRSFVPPSRDEESETQRKAHAKMVRSTRRSTQGVTLEDLKSAEQLMKNKKQEAFSLENVAKAKEGENEIDSVTAPLRKKSTDVGDEDKESERTSQTREGTQAVLQRRKKPKRRSTGRVQVNMDEIDPEKRAARLAEQQQKQAAGEEVSDDDEEEEDSSLSERGEGTKAATSNVNSRSTTRSTSLGPENGEPDYKKLYEEQLAENTKILDRLRITETDLQTARETIEANNKKNNTEKREKRALERKLSEMEEELKLLEHLKQENQKLKDENGALIRVISKLSK
ncbi:unnamed protein product, partial [Meganyctiphanes norvegica]